MFLLMILAFDADFYPRTVSRHSPSDSCTCHRADGDGAILTSSSCLMPDTLSIRERMHRHVRRSIGSMKMIAKISCVEHRIIHLTGFSSTVLGTKLTIEIGTMYV